MYARLCHRVIVWIEPTLQVESQCSYVVHPASYAMAIGISQHLDMKIVLHQTPMLKIHVTLPTYSLSVKVHALT
jgi:hypothetical protein